MIYRIDVSTRTTDGGADPIGEAVRHQIAEFGGDVGSVRTTRVYLIDTDESERQKSSESRENFSPIQSWKMLTPSRDKAKRRRGSKFT
jgi:phosphoribosylformylglycinamidine (FGAM) synthase PurS component